MSINYRQFAFHLFWWTLITACPLRLETGTFLFHSSRIVRSRHISHQFKAVLRYSQIFLTWCSRSKIKVFWDVTPCVLSSCRIQSLGGLWDSFGKITVVCDITPCNLIERHEPRTSHKYEHCNINLHFWASFNALKILIFEDRRFLLFSFTCYISSSLQDLVHYIIILITELPGPG